MKNTSKLIYLINNIYSINTKLCNYILRYYDHAYLLKKKDIFSLMENYFLLNEMYIQFNSLKKTSHISITKYYNIFKDTVYKIFDKEVIDKEIKYTARVYLYLTIHESSFDFLNNKYLNYNHNNIYTYFEKPFMVSEFITNTTNKFSFFNTSLIRKKLFSFHSINYFSIFYKYVNYFAYPNTNFNLISDNGILYVCDKSYYSNISNNYDKHLRYLNYCMLSLDKTIRSDQLLLSSNINFINNNISFTVNIDCIKTSMNDYSNLHYPKRTSFSSSSKINKNLLIYFNYISHLKKNLFSLKKKLSFFSNMRRIGVISYNNTMRNIFITLSTSHGKHLYHISSGHLKYLGRKKTADSSKYNLVSKFIYKIRSLLEKHSIYYLRIIINGYFDNISVFIKSMFTKWYSSSNIILMLKRYLLFFKKYIIFLKHCFLTKRNLLKVNINQYNNIIFTFFSIYDYIQYKAEKHAVNSIRILDIQIKNKKFFSK